MARGYLTTRSMAFWYASLVPGGMMYIILTFLLGFDARRKGAAQKEPCLRVLRIGLGCLLQRLDRILLAALVVKNYSNVL